MVIICTTRFLARNSPFTLEFMSDDLEGIGGESGNTEWQTLTHARGFKLYSAQVACSWWGIILLMLVLYTRYYNMWRRISRLFSNLFLLLGWP